MISKLLDIINPERVAARTYRTWYLLCREAMERDGGPESRRVLEYIGPRVSAREDFEKEFWGPSLKPSWYIEKDKR